MVLAFLAVVLGVFAVIALSGDPGTDSTDRLQTVDSAMTTGPQPATTTTGSPRTTALTAPTTTVAAATPTAVFTIPGNEPTTVAQPAVVPPTAPSTAAPVTVAPTAAPTLSPDAPAVTIIGSVGPCHFGAECLLAGFTIHNFASQPSEFVCEFADGSRYTFHFNRQEVERACATGDPTDSITIEVAGVRSATYVHP